MGDEVSCFVHRDVFAFGYSRGAVFHSPNNSDAYYIVAFSKDGGSATTEDYDVSLVGDIFDDFTCSGDESIVVDFLGCSMWFLLIFAVLARDEVFDAGSEVGVTAHSGNGGSFEDALDAQS